MLSSKNAYFAGKPTITCLISGGVRKIHCTYDDKSERIEEFDQKTHEILVRKAKKSSQLKENPWVYEIGEAKQLPGDNTILLTSKNPVFLRKDTQTDYQFRIRNLTYPQEVYSVEIDDEKQQIVVRTSNKKYFKKIDIFDMTRFNIILQKDQLKWTYQNNTLIITYPKPDVILKWERDMRQEFEKLNKKKPQEGDIECVQQ